ncbi:hypothetical protein JCGZ_03220 [Jatropha curcas]|uniref:Uncharacterized protein n=1 Tax=Jatropha curcas TaxID=180498 RepID=A0A067L9B1_JATCU|nr:hypothetical protein JCGZ_03220 [Jatropha curcas]
MHHLHGLCAVYNGTKHFPDQKAVEKKQSTKREFVEKWRTPHVVACATMVLSARLHHRQTLLVDPRLSFWTRDADELRHGDYWRLQRMCAFFEGLSPLGSRFKIESSSVQVDFSASTFTSSNRMRETNVPLSDIEKMIEKIVAANLEKLMRSNKGKEKVVIEDDKEAKDESEKREHVDDTWQDDEFFK